MEHLQNGILLSHKKEENFTLCDSMDGWMDLENIMFSEISQLEKEVPYNFTHMWNLMNKLN